MTSTKNNKSKKDNNKNNIYEVVIVGAGIAGLTLGALLGKANISCAIIGNVTPPDKKDIIRKLDLSISSASHMINKGHQQGSQSLTRTIALMQSSLDVIKAIDCWQECKKYSSPLQTMRILDYSLEEKNPTELEFEAEQSGYDAFGYNIPNAMLLAALYEKIQNTPCITTYIPNTVKDFTSHESKPYIQATLENNKKLKASLIIGADGAHSFVRKHAQIPTWEKQYQQSAITCVVNHSFAHNHTSTEFHRPEGPLAFVPMPGNQSSVVWVNPEKKSEDIMRLKKNDFECLLSEQSHNILGALTLHSGPDAWPLRSIKAKSIISDRIALVAEAAHVLSPITAQGLNLSLRDCKVLARILQDHHKLGMDLGSQTLLKKYEKERRLDITTRVHGVDSFHRLVSTDNDIIKTIRRMGAKAIDVLPFLQKLSTKYGLSQF